MASGYYWEPKSGLQRKLGHALTMLLPQFLSLKTLETHPWWPIKTSLNCAYWGLRKRVIIVQPCLGHLSKQKITSRTRGWNPALIYTLCNLDQRQNYSAGCSSGHSLSSCPGETDPMARPDAGASRCKESQCTADRSALQKHFPLGTAPRKFPAEIWPQSWGSSSPRWVQPWCAFTRLCFAPRRMQTSSVTLTAPTKGLSFRAMPLTFGGMLARASYLWWFVPHHESPFLTPEYNAIEMNGKKKKFCGWNLCHGSTYLITN